jgi:hypothetical protein
MQFDERRLEFMANLATDLCPIKEPWRFPQRRALFKYAVYLSMEKFPVVFHFEHIAFARPVNNTSPPTIVALQPDSANPRNKSRLTQPKLKNHANSQSSFQSKTGRQFWQSRDPSNGAEAEMVDVHG